MLLVKTYLDKSAIHGLGVFAAQAIRKGTGARALRGLIEKLMLDLMFDAPEGGNIVHVKITAAVVRGDNKPIVRRKQDAEAA